MPRKPHPPKLWRSKSKLDKYDRSITRLFAEGRSLTEIQKYLLKYVHIDVAKSTLHDWIKKNCGGNQNG